MQAIWQYIIGFLGAVLVALGGYAYVTISGLKLELSENQAKMVVALTNAESCSKEVEKQNKLVDSLKADREDAIRKYEEWKKKPKKIRYNTVYKYIPKEVIRHEDSCENTKHMLDAVRNIDFDQL